MRSVASVSSASASPSSGLAPAALGAVALTLLALVFVPPARADRTAGERPPIVDAPPPPPASAPVQPGSPETQRLYADPQATAVIPPEQAGAILQRFSVAYEKLSRPRVALVVNRPVVRVGPGGLPLTGAATTTTSVRSSATSDGATTSAGTALAPQTVINIHPANTTPAHPPLPALGAGTTTGQSSVTTTTRTYGAAAGANLPTLADRQTARDVERLFGRPLRAGGAMLIDADTAARLLGEHPLEHFVEATDDVARRDREALLAQADVVIEVLVGARPVTVRSVAGEETLTAPDIQATAIRLKDAAILGQASATDVLGRDRDAGRVLRRHEVRDITEAVALALMDDIASTAR